MKRADQTTLAKLTRVLNALRDEPSLTERKPGIFYLKTSAFAHFHDDAEGIFADIKLDLKEYTRLRVSTATEQNALIKLIKTALHK
jgi:hypothetical protein